MKFEEILLALRSGKKIRKRYWCKDTYIYINSYGKFETQSGRPFEIILDSFYDLENDDWEIIDEKKIVKLRDLTEEQYDKWLDANCKGVYAGACENCPFIRVDCGCCDYSTDDTVWYLNKDLFSDKFLDQEIEIDEE